MFKWFWTIFSLGAPIVSIVQSLNNRKLPIYIFEPLNFNGSTYDTICEISY